MRPRREGEPRTIEIRKGKNDPSSSRQMKIGDPSLKQGKIQMTDHQIVDSSFTAIINAPFGKIDIPAWCFNLPEQEYQACSPAHLSAGFTTTPDGKRMSINVEIIGGSLMVQHYVEMLGRKDHLILDSESDVFTPTGRTRIHVTWELMVKEGGNGRCEFTNRVRSYATEEMLSFLARQGMPFDQFRAQRQPASIAHNREETPLFAASIERAALRNMSTS
jgi:hypothetical protein